MNEGHITVLLLVNVILKRFRHVCITHLLHKECMCNSFCKAALVIAFISSVSSLTPGLFLKCTDACSKYAKIRALADTCAENKIMFPFLL